MVRRKQCKKSLRISWRGVEVAEKNVLPSAEDLKAEKTHENLQKGIEGFTPDKLKQVKTKEPASGAELMKTEMATGATIKAVEGFDKTGLKQAETTERILFQIKKLSK